MRFLKYLLVVAVTVAVTLGCVYGLSRVSCDSCGSDEEARASPVTVLSLVYTDAEENSEDGELLAEGYKTDVSRGTRIAFDVTVIVLTVGVIVLVWLIIRRVMKRNGGKGRRFR